MSQRSQNWEKVFWLEFFWFRSRGAGGLGDGSVSELGAGLNQKQGKWLLGTLVTSKINKKQLKLNVCLQIDVELPIWVLQKHKISQKRLPKQRISSDLKQDCKVIISQKTVVSPEVDKVRDEEQETNVLFDQKILGTNQRKYNMTGNHARMLGEQRVNRFIKIFNLCEETSKHDSSVSCAHQSNSFT